MFRGIVKGLSELFKKRGSIEMSELPRVSNVINDALSQNQPPPVQQNQNLQSGPSSAVTTQNAFRRSSTANSMSRLSSSVGVTPIQFTEAKSSKLLSPDDLVRVRIWTSKTKDGQNTYGANVVINGGNVGHATLETSKTYASIWPAETPRRLKQSVTSGYVSSPEKDVLLESNRQPDYVLDFYSLDVKAIEKVFEEMKKAQEPWTLFGGNKGYSCSSMTLTLLEIGGLNKLAGTVSRGIVSPTSKLAVSPNNLVNQLSLAKLAEEQKYPEVMDFSPHKNQKSKPKESYEITYKAGKINIANTIKELVSGDSKSENEILTNTTPKRSL